MTTFAISNKNRTCNAQAQCAISLQCKLQQPGKKRSMAHRGRAIEACDSFTLPPFGAELRKLNRFKETSTLFTDVIY